MKSLLTALKRLLNGDLAAGRETVEATHPYFGGIVWSGGRDDPTGYWDAEVRLPGATKPVGVIIQSPRSGPTAADERVCRELLGDPDALFERCRAAFAPVYLEWARAPLPSDWRPAFQLDGVSLPPGGDLAAEWDVCWFVAPAGHYFTATFAGGRVRDVVVDG